MFSKIDIVGDIDCNRVASLYLVHVANYQEQELMGNSADIPASFWNRYAFFKKKDPGLAGISWTRRLGG